MGRGRGARLVELMTDLPHSRELSALGSLRAADGVDPIRLQRGEIDWGSEAAGDPLRWLLRRHFRGRLVVLRTVSARKVWGVTSGRGRKEVGKIGLGVVAQHRARTPRSRHHKNLPD